MLNMVLKVGDSREQGESIEIKGYNRFLFILIIECKYKLESLVDFFLICFFYKKILNCICIKIVILFCNYKQFMFFVFFCLFLYRVGEEVGMNFEECEVYFEFGCCLFCFIFGWGIFCFYF